MNVFKRLSWGRRCGLRLTSTWSTYLQQISFPPSGVHCIGVFFSQSRLTVFGIFKAKCYSPTPNMLTVLSQYSYVLTHWISPPFLLSLLAELTEEYLLPAIFCKISAFYSIVCIVASVSFFVFVFLCLFNCPGQLNRWPCHSLTQSVSELTFYFSVFRTLRSSKRHMSPFWQLIRWTRRYCLANKKTKTLGAV